MIGPRLRAALALTALALPAGGCVAAAVPLVAAGAMATRGDAPEPREVDDLATPRIAGPEAAAPIGSPTAEPARLGNTPASSTSGADTASLIVLPAETAAAGDYDAFLGYASAQAQVDPVSEGRRSAILAVPGSLEPDTTDCAIRPPAVVIDLDPGEATLDPAGLAPDPALARGLAALRMQEIEIFWISAASAGRAGTLRSRLRETGLDPQGRDGLLLMRRVEDRKQLRRKELAQTHCVVAIAGDRKSDFDELFGYLKDPSAAADLDALVGKGWFLVAQPAANGEPL